MKKEIKDLKCAVCGKQLAHWNEEEQCSYTDIPCEEGLYFDKKTGKGYCEKCFDKE